MKTQKLNLENKNKSVAINSSSENRIKLNLVIILLSLFSYIGVSQTTANSIVGSYMVPSKDGAITIWESNGKYYGKIILNKDASKLDVNNPDVKKQSRKVLGLTILNDFKFNSSDTWNDGTIYDPKSGKTYSCNITQSANGDLNIRGFIGLSLFGRTETFTKLKK